MALHLPSHRLNCALLAMATLCLTHLSAAPRAYAQETFSDAVPVRYVSDWSQAPHALGRRYRTSRFTQSSLSIASGAGALVGGAIQLSGLGGNSDERNPVVGVILVTGALSTITLGTLGLLGPFSDGELQAARMATVDNTDDIRSWVLQRRTVARHARTARAIALGATASGLIVSAFVVQDPASATEVAGVETIAGEDASLRNVRIALSIIGLGTGIGALITGLSPTAEDRILKRLEPASDVLRQPPAPALSLAFTGTGGALRCTW